MAILDIAMDKVDQIDPGKFKVNTTQAQTTNWNVDKPQTVAGQVESLVAKDSPLLQQAATRAKQEMQKRGLRNSSIAIGAGQGAVIDRALPIAQQDASMYGAAAKYNTDATNQTSAFNAGAANTAAAQTVQAGVNVAQANQGVQANQAQQRYDAAVKGALSDADLASRLQLADKDAATRLQLSDKELANQLLLSDKDVAGRLAVADKEAATRESLADKDVYGRLAVADKDKEIRESLADKDVYGRLAVADKDKEIRESLADKDVYGRITAANIDAKFKNEIQQSANLSNSWNAMIQEIGQIQNNPNLGQEAKTTLINNTMGAFKSFANFWNKSTNVDVSSLLNFNIGPSAAGNGPTLASAAQQAAQQPYNGYFDASGGGGFGG